MKSADCVCLMMPVGRHPIGGEVMAAATVILIISFASLFITNWLGRKNNKASRMKDVTLR